MDRVFGKSKSQRELLNTILGELELKFDRDGNRRTAYSLRHTYICLRLMEGADIYQVAKNCRTSVEMIETFYASHIKNTLDAAAINVKKGTIAGNGKNTKTRSFRGCGRILLPLRCRSLRRRKPRSLCQRIPDGLNGLRQMAANKQIIDTDDRNRLP